MTCDNRPAARQTAPVVDIEHMNKRFGYYIGVKVKQCATERTADVTSRQGQHMTSAVHLIAQHLQAFAVLYRHERHPPNALLDQFNNLRSEAVQNHNVATQVDVCCATVAKATSGAANTACMDWQLQTPVADASLM